MNDYTKKIKDKLDVVTLTHEDFNEIIKDRLDFGFDSIYFRYAEVCDELAAYKAELHRTDPVSERKHMDHKKMHFYQALEQLVHAHEPEDRKND